MAAEIKTSSIYQMHKYWGKKPGDKLKSIISNYSKEGDLILDPFSGFGGLGIEGVLLNRNVILNDLNPMANFISECVLNSSVNINKLIELFTLLKAQYSAINTKWYTYGNHEIIAILRDKNDKPLKLKIRNTDTNIISEQVMTDIESDSFTRSENLYPITTWYPKTKLICNSRIGATDNMSVADLFSKRALICNSLLFHLINQIPSCIEKDCLTMAFTANLANCSKLVPPINSRGEMAPGAWMTGFYIGNTYLDNNVFHYFENRVKKIITGKTDYLKIYNSKATGQYQITNYDAKHLQIEDGVIDFVFTDFPYGDTVPYFEQSQLWNMWLDKKVDYNNEIVISDSKQRNKNIDNFVADIETAIAEIARVLKDKAYFVFTFHSLCGKEWTAILNALVKHHLKFVDCQTMTQKTFAPRQLNRKKTIKGDLLVVYQKDSSLSPKINNKSIKSSIIEEIAHNYSHQKLYDTNELITSCVKLLLKTTMPLDDFDFLTIIEHCFQEENNMWRLKDAI